MGCQDDKRVLRHTVWRGGGGRFVGLCSEPQAFECGSQLGLGPNGKVIVYGIRLRDRPRMVYVLLISNDHECWTNRCPLSVWTVLRFPFQSKCSRDSDFHEPSNRPYSKQ